MEQPEQCQYHSIPTWSKERCWEVLNFSETTLKTFGDRKKITAGVVRAAILKQLKLQLACEQQTQFSSITTISTEVERIIELVNLQKYLIETSYPNFPRLPPIMQTANVPVNEQVKSMHRYNLQLLSSIQQHQQHHQHQNQNQQAQTGISNTVNTSNASVQSNTQPQSGPTLLDRPPPKSKSASKRKNVRFQDDRNADGLAAQVAKAVSTSQEVQCNTNVADPAHRFPRGYTSEDRIYTGDEKSDHRNSDEDNNKGKLNNQIPTVPPPGSQKNPSRSNSFNPESDLVTIFDDQNRKGAGPVPDAPLH